MPDFSGDKYVVIPSLRKLRETDDKVKALEKKIKSLKDLRTEQMEEAFLLMEKETIQSITLDDKLFFRKVTKIFGWKKEEKVEAEKWLKENGFADLFQETVNAKTLSSELKRSVEEDGTELPDELFHKIVQNRIGINKAVKR